MLLIYIVYAIAVSIVSWSFGLIVNLILKKTAIYAGLSNLNFIRSERINTIIGVKLFKMFLVKSFWRKLNPTLNIKQAVSLENLKTLKEEMTNSEIIHLAALLIVWALCIAGKLGVLNTRYINKESAYPLAIINIILNLYPVLVQQYNKRRLNRMITVLSSKRNR